MVGQLEAIFMGLDAQDVVDLNSALPVLEEVVTLAEAEWPKIAPRVPEMLALVNKEYPKIAPHIPALLRIARKVIQKQRSL